MIDLISRTYWPKTLGGAEKYFYELKKRLSKEYDLKLYTWDEVSEENVIKVNTPKISLIGSLIFSLKTAWKVNNSDSKLVHVNEFWSEYTPLFLKKPFVTSIHDLPGPGFLRRVVVKSAKKAEKVFYLSETTKKVLVDCGVSPDKMIRNPPGIDECLREAKGDKKKYSPNSEKVILHASRIAPNKDLITMIKGLSLLEEHDFIFYVMGQKMEWTDYYDKVVRTIKEEGLKDKVKILGMVSEEVKKELFNSADVYVHASYYGEGFGIPLVEAQACGVPVVSSDYFVQTGVVKKDWNASLFEQRNPRGFVRAIRKVLDDKNYRKKIVRNGKEFSKKFDWDNTAKTTAKVYEKYV